MIGRLKCFVGWHAWHRSRFVVLGAREADFVCRRCGKVALSGDA